jgi:RNA polymerase sigma-70 factor (ECF subfamily)
VSAPQRTDDELMVAIAAGNHDALEALYHRHARWLMVRLHQRCADADTVDTAVQETFISVWRSAARYRPVNGEAGAWLWSIALRRLIDQLRRRPAPTPVDSVPEAAAEPLPTPGSTAHHLLSQLPPDLHSVVTAVYLDGLTTAEAGVLLGLPQGTVKSRLSRARTMLKEERR